jgi:hypothetical protein
MSEIVLTFQNQSHTPQYSLIDWNVSGFFTFADSGFTNLTIVDNVICLSGSGDITMIQNIFNGMPYNQNLISIVDQDGLIKSVRELCFGDAYDAENGCNMLATVTLNGCTTIGFSGFAWCSRLQNITMPEVTYIEEAAFTYIGYGLTTPIIFDFPKCTYIGIRAFFSVINLGELHIPKATYLGGLALCNCMGLIYLDISSLPYCGNVLNGTEDVFLFIEGNNITVKGLRIINPLLNEIDGDLFYLCENNTITWIDSSIDWKQVVKYPLPIEVPEAGSSLERIEVGRATFRTESPVLTNIIRSHAKRTIPKISDLIPLPFIKWDLYYESDIQVLGFSGEGMTTLQFTSDFINANVPNNGTIYTVSFILVGYVLQDRSAHSFSKLFGYNLFYSKLKGAQHYFDSSIRTLYDKFDTLGNFPPGYELIYAQLATNIYNSFLGRYYAGVVPPDAYKAICFTRDREMLYALLPTKKALGYQTDFGGVKTNLYYYDANEGDTWHLISFEGGDLFTFVSSMVIDISQPSVNMGETPKMADYLNSTSLIRVYHYTTNPVDPSVGRSVFVIKPIGMDTFKIPVVYPNEQYAQVGIGYVIEGNLIQRQWQYYSVATQQTYDGGGSIRDTLTTVSKSAFIKAIKPNQNSYSKSLERQLRFFTYDTVTKNIHGFSPIVRAQINSAGAKFKLMIIK